MPLKEKTIGKLYWSIGEVAAELGVNASLIRYWEKEFGTLRPKRTGKGDRLYTRKEIEQLQHIHHLVKEKGFTLNGAKTQLTESRADEMVPAAVDIDALRERLLRIKELVLRLPQGE